MFTAVGLEEKMSDRSEDPKGQEVCPGLWELTNTPKSVRISRDAAEVYGQAARSKPNPLSKKVEAVLERDI